MNNNFLIILFLFGCFFWGVVIGLPNKPRQRYFLIGYVGDSKKGLFTGGYDTTLFDYPNLYKTIEYLSIHYSLTNVRIIGITEYNMVDRKTFLKN